MAQYSKRGRNSGRRRQNGNNNPNRSMDSQGPEVKIRGTAAQIHDKYQALARDAFSSGDRIRGESLMQHAEHYYRLMKSMQPDKPAEKKDEASSSGDQQAAQPSEETQAASVEDDKAAASAEEKPATPAEQSKDEAQPEEKPRRRRRRRKADDAETTDKAASNDKGSEEKSSDDEAPKVEPKLEEAAAE